MTWTHRWFNASWRLAILLLPWQARWFHEGPLLGGYPWEGGRWSIYLSWLPLAAAVYLGYLRRGARLAPTSPANAGDGSTPSTPTSKIIGRRYIWIVTTVVALSIFVSTYRPATTQWWIEVILLIALARTLIREVDRHDLIRWMIYAIIPHAVLGLAQYATQFVIGSKWLGIATQDPLTRGVSVVDVGGTRWLRAYGGLPHPNILGGWLVLGLGALVGAHGVRPRVDAVHPYGEKIITTLFSVVLILSFSRSAWLATAVLLLATSYEIFRSSNKENRSRFIALVSVILCAVGVTALLCAPLIQTRTTTTAPLETKSLSEREQGREGATELFKRHPWLGVGPRTVSIALARESIAWPLTIPVPPHNVFLLILCEIGIIGILILFWSLNRVMRANSRVEPTAYILPLAFLPILLLDHYLWSTWSGLTLTTLILAVYLSQNRGLSRPI